MVELVCGAVGRSCDVAEMGRVEWEMGDGYWIWYLCWVCWFEKELEVFFGIILFSFVRVRVLVNGMSTDYAVMY